MTTPRERDPRFDPKPGDAVKSCGETRYVADLMVHSDGSATIRYALRQNFQRARHYTPRKFWRNWAEGGKVIHAAD